MMADTADLQKELLRDLRGRIKEEDESAPLRCVLTPYSAQFDH